jgi:hypothetical protein
MIGLQNVGLLRQIKQMDEMEASWAHNLTKVSFNEDESTRSQFAVASDNSVAI